MSDIASLYDFLVNTPEGGLRKMFVDNKNFTEAHFNLLMKVVRACNGEQFRTHFESQDFPKVKMNANDVKLKETFWNECLKVWTARGLWTGGAPVPKVPKAA
jgi:hypothetical protein